MTSADRIRSHRTRRVALAATLVVVATGPGSPVSAGTAHRDPHVDAVQPAARGRLVSVAGDIACGTSVRAYNHGNGTATQCRQKYTSRLILGSDAVWTLGDHAYPTATLENLRTAYHPTWGRKKAVTYPTPGDHDYDDPGRGYFRYFHRPAYYTFTMGDWRVFSLNSEIRHSARSPQTRWLQRRLAAPTGARCIAAFWSTPRWTSGEKAPGDASFTPFWRALYRARADLVLSGDTHNYERFAPRTPAGAVRASGIRQFVVGTGGRSLVGFPKIQRASQVRIKKFGVLRLRLRPGSYGWSFVNEARRSLDSGSRRCH
jgi:acid phosphatase type 7